MGVREVDTAGATIHKLVDRAEAGTADGALWADAHLAIQKVENPQDQQRLMAGLEETGLLPRLVVDCAAALDTDGRKGISKQELQKAIADTTGNVNNATKLAAQAALEHWDEINTKKASGRGSIDVLSDAELYAWKDKNPGTRKADDGYYYEQNGDQQDDIVQESNSYSRGVLQRPEATDQEKMQAVAELGDGAEIELTDKNGQTRKYKVQVENISGDRNYVHLYDAETGKIVLRGIGENGVFTQEKDRRGNPVPFSGTEWSSRFGDSRITKFNDYSEYGS